MISETMPKLAKPIIRNDTRSGRATLGAAPARSCPRAGLSTSGQISTSAATTTSAATAQNCWIGVTPARIASTDRPEAARNPSPQTPWLRASTGLPVAWATRSASTLIATLAKDGIRPKRNSAEKTGQNPAACATSTGIGAEIRNTSNIERRLPTASLIRAETKVPRMNPTGCPASASPKAEADSPRSRCTSASRPPKLPNSTAWSRKISMIRRRGDISVTAGTKSPAPCDHPGRGSGRPPRQTR